MDKELANRPDDAEAIEGSAPSPEEEPVTEEPDESVEEVVQSQEGEEEQAKPTQGKSRVQKRIDTLTKQKYELKNEVEELRARIMEYQQKIDQMMGFQYGQPASPQAMPQVAEKPQRPKLEDYDYDVEAYEKALNDYEQQLAVWQAQQMQSEAMMSQLVAERYAYAEQKLAPGMREYPDFADVVITTSHLYSPHVADAVLASDIAHHLAYYLGKNPNILFALNSMNPVQAVREVMALENNLKQQVNGQRKAKSSAPEPITPVGGSGASPGKDPSKMSVEEYIAWRRRQRFGG